MKKFGFSRKSGKSSPAPSDNPYAQPPPAEDPYANDSSRASMASSYSQSSGPPGGSTSGLPSGPRVGLPSGPRGGGYGGGGPPPRPGAAPKTNSYGNSGPGYGGGPAPRPAAAPPTNSYGSSGSGYGGGPAPRPSAAPQTNSPGNSGQGYGSDKLGSGSGYGANRYKNEASFQQNQNVSVPPPPYSSRDGGYGGLGTGDRERVGSQQDRFGGGSGIERSNSGQTTGSSTRGELFGGAKDRYNPERGNAYDPTRQPPPEARPGQPRAPGAYGASGESSGSYGGYGEQRELTEEEQEEATYRDTLAQKKQIKQESAASIGRSLQLVDDMFETHNETNSRLAQQGESLYNAERNMDMADAHNARGYNKTKELQTVNRSMFSVHVANPFTAKKRSQMRDDEVLDRHRAEKDQREETRRNQFAANQMFQNQGREMANYDAGQTSYDPTQKKKSPYAYEDDEEEEELEDYIEDGLTRMGQSMGKLKLGVIQTGAALDEQNKMIDRIGAKTDRVDDGVRRNRNELDKIR